MTAYVSNTRCITHGAVLVVAVLAGLVGCENSKQRLSLPAIPKLQAPKAQSNKLGGVSYRQTAGESIAPLVIADDPAPVQNQPASAGQSSRGGTLNGDPNGITRETLNSSIQGAMGALANCFANLTQDPMVAVSFEADPSGRPSLVRVNGAPPDAERCIRNVVQNIRFPGFEGKGVQVDLPLSFHRVSQPAQPGNPSGERQAQAPPLFLEP
jgi:hypothetical protein